METEKAEAILDAIDNLPAEQIPYVIAKSLMTIAEILAGIKEAIERR